MRGERERGYLLGTDTGLRRRRAHPTFCSALRRGHERGGHTHSRYTHSAPSHPLLSVVAVPQPYPHPHPHPTLPHPPPPHTLTSSVRGLEGGCRFSICDLAQPDFTCGRCPALPPTSPSPSSSPLLGKHRGIGSISPCLSPPGYISPPEKTNKSGKIFFFGRGKKKKKKGKKKGKNKKGIKIK